MRIAKPTREGLACDSCWSLEKIINKTQPNTDTDLSSEVHLGIFQFISHVNNLTWLMWKGKQKRIRSNVLLCTKTLVSCTEVLTAST